MTPTRAFTLVEVLVALVIFATVITAYTTLSRQAGQASIQTRSASELSRTLAGAARRARLGDPSYLNPGPLSASAVRAAVNPSPQGDLRITVTPLGGDPPQLQLTGTADGQSASVTVTPPGGSN